MYSSKFCYQVYKYIVELLILFQKTKNVQNVCPFEQNVCPKIQNVCPK